MRNDFKFFLLFFALTLLFFFPVFSSKIPFPGDLLISENPYRTESYLGYNPGTYPHKAQGPDVITQIYPWRYFSVEEIKKGNIPFWNPYNFSGNPQMANFQTGIFYPFNILYLFLPFNLAWTVLVMLQPLLAGIFMYIFLSKGLGLLRLPSFIGGIAFAFSSYMTVWIEYGNIGSTLLWLPLVLFLTKRFSEKISAANFLFLVLSLLTSFLGGYIQGLFYVYALSVLYFIFLIKFGKSKHALQKSVLFLTALIFPFILGAFQLLPTLDLFNLSTRGSYSLSQIPSLLLPPYYWVTAFASDFFGNPATRNYFINGTYIERVMYAGVPILFFAILALRFVKSKEARFFAILGGLSLIVATNLPGIKFLYSIPIPVISTTVPTRELSVFIFCLTILGAMGLNHFISKENIKSRIPVVFILIYVLFWAAALILKLDVSQKNLILPSALALGIIIIFYSPKRLRKLSAVALSALVIFDLLYFFHKITPFSPEELAYPDTRVTSFLKETAGINRFWGYGSAYIKPNFQTVDKTYSPEGLDPLHLVSYTELLASTRDGSVPKVLPRPDANIAPGYGLTDMRDNTHRQRVLNLLGVKYIFHQSDGSDTFPSEIYHPVSQIGGWQIYENRNALPRFFMTGKYIVVKDKSSVLPMIYDENINLRDTLILEDDPALLIESDSKGDAELLTYDTQKVSFRTESDGASLLFLSDNYYPEWKVKVDGEDAKVLVANYSFRAVEVPEGEHDVEFYYYPEKFLLGLKISAFGVLALIMSLLFIKYVKK